MTTRSQWTPLDEVLAVLKGRMAAESGAARPWHGFWYPRPDLQFPPPVTARPEDHSGSESLRIDCAPAGASPAERKRQMRTWCESLPGLGGVRFLWVRSRMTAEILEAVCRMQGLVGLHANNSSISSFESLSSLPNLAALRLGVSAGLRSLEPLGRMPRLKWLELANLRRIDDFEVLGRLTHLDGLAFDAADGKLLEVESLAPLAGLTQLTWLNLGGVRARDRSLRPLQGLRKLIWLGLARHYPAQEFARLSAALPSTECPWFRPFNAMPGAATRCPRCEQGVRVMPSGSGMRSLCTSCDERRLAAHVRAFERDAALACAAPAIDLDSAVPRSGPMRKGRR